VDQLRRWNHLLLSSGLHMYWTTGAACLCAFSCVRLWLHCFVCFVFLLSFFFMHNLSQSLALIFVTGLVWSPHWFNSAIYLYIYSIFICYVRLLSCTSIQGCADHRCMFVPQVTFSISLFL
jgi:hypothetical protein